MGSFKTNLWVWLPTGAVLALAFMLAAAVVHRQANPIAAAFSPRGGSLRQAAAAAAASALAKVPLPTCNITLGGDPRWSKRCDLLTDV